jgi:hypothetical protein
VAAEGEQEGDEPGSPQSFTSDAYHPTRLYRHFYENIATSEEWMVDDFDAMIFLKEFRDSSVQLSKTQGNISDIRILYVKN